MADENLEIIDGQGYLEVRVSGPYSLEQFKLHMGMAVQATKERRVKALLLDVSGLIGTPTTMDRHSLGRSGVESKVDFRVAALITPTQAEDNFASTVARNRGVNVQTFTDRAAALAWLLGLSESPSA